MSDSGRGKGRKGKVLPGLPAEPAVLAPRGRRRSAAAGSAIEPILALAADAEASVQSSPQPATNQAEPAPSDHQTVEAPAPQPIVAEADPVAAETKASEPEGEQPNSVEAETAPAETMAAPAAAFAPQPEAVVAPVTETPMAAPAAEPTQKGPASMATTFETPRFGTDRLQGMFGDINDRAKTAMEKSAKMAEDMTEFTKGNVEAIVASTRVAAKGAESLTQDMAETARKQFETATATMKSFVAAKSPTELFQLQSDYAKSYFDSLVAETSRYSESMLKLAGDVAQPISSRFAVAAEKIKSPAL